MVHLKKHLKSTSHACTMCNGIFSTEDGLKCHRMEIHNVRIFICTSCGWEDFNYFVYEKHMKKHYDESKNKCFDCDTGMNNKYKVISHVQSHLIKSPRDSLQCEICEKYFTLLQINSHMKRHSDVDDSIECRKCNYKYKTPNNLKTHQQLVHGYFPCNECEYVAQSKRKMNAHKMEKHQRRDAYVECKECRYFFISTKVFEKHVSEVHPTLPWKDLAEFKSTLVCSICGNVKQNVRALMNHMLIHSEYRSKCRNNSEVFECKLCRLFYVSKTAIEIHCIRAHSEVHSNGLYDIRKEPKCSICGKVIDQLSLLNLHIKRHKHNEEKQNGSEFIECSACHLFFEIRQSLSAHVSQIHPSEVWQDLYQLQTELKCWFCGLVLPTVKAMNPHVRSHTVKNKPQSKMYIRCKCCRLYYATKITFEAHVIKSHPGSSAQELLEYVDEIRCVVCGEVRDVTRQMNQHIRRLHNSDK